MFYFTWDIFTWDVDWKFITHIVLAPCTQNIQKTGELNSHGILWHSISTKLTLTSIEFYKKKKYHHQESAIQPGWAKTSWLEDLNGDGYMTQDSNTK